MAINLNHPTSTITTASGILIHGDTGGLVLASGSTAQRPSTTNNNGLIRYNTDTNQVEIIVNGSFTTVANAADLATVAFSGSYTDLSNTPAAYTLPTASSSVLGGIKVGTGLSIDGSGVLSVISGGGSYTLPAATTSTLGGVIVGTGLTVDGSGNLSANVDSVAGRTGAVVLSTTDISGLGTMATQNANSVAITGGTITGLPSPSNGSDAANKSYVDNATTNLDAKASCRVATTGALNATYNNQTSGVGATLTNNAYGAIVIDGITLVANDRVLVKDQATQYQNGIYFVSFAGDGTDSWVLTRTIDFDNSTNVLAGSYAVIEQGSTNSGTFWIQTQTGPFTIGSSAIVFTQLSVAPQTIALTGDITGSGAGTIAVTVNKINGASLNTTTPTSGNLLIGNGTSWKTQSIIGDGTLTSTGLLTVTQTNGVTFAPSATIDTTNANNITTGTLSATRLPSPTAYSLGGVESYAPVAHQWINTISTAGVPASSQPDFSDLTGSVAATQLPALTGDVTTSAGTTATTVAKINGVALGSTTATAGNLLIGSGSQWNSETISGDAYLTSAGTLTVTKTNGTAFATSATTDTTNASNITSGSLNLSRIAAIGNNTVLANTSGSTASPVATSVSAILDTIGNTQGDVLYRSATGWSVLAPGTSGNYLTTNGSGANPSWSAGNAGTVTSISTGSGLTGGPISTTGTIAVATNGITSALFRQSAANTLVGNPTGSTANVADITIGSTLSFVSGSLQTLAITGDVTSSANSFSTTIAAGAVTSNKMASGAAATNVGSLSGDLSSTLPNPTVAKINGTALGTTTATSGNLLVGSGSQWVTQSVSGDATMAASGALTVTKTNGVAFAASATTDTTNATNITSGTLPAARLPTPTASTLGGVESYTAVAHQWINSISTGGVPASSQPAFSDISGTLSTTQLPALAGDVSSSAGSNNVTVNTYNGGTAFGTMAAENSSSVSITGGSITGMSSPVNASDVATKSYVDNATAGLDNKASCRVATTANLSATYANGSSGVGATLTNSGTQAAIVIDGVTLVSGNRVLVKNQSTAAQNGMYSVTTVGTGSTNWVLTRTTDFNGSSSGAVVEGAYTIIEEGTTNAGTLWIETGSGPFTIGTTSISFTELSVASQTITFTGDVTGTGAGSVALTIAAGAVTAAKMATGAAASNVGTLSGDLTGSLPSPTVAKINGVALGTTTATSGNLLIGNGSTWNTQSVSGDGALSSTGSLTVTKTNGVAFAPSATTDTTNASNISSGSLSLSRIASIANNTVLGNNTGSSGSPTAITASNILDMVGNVQGDVLYRGSSGWNVLTPGTAGQALVSGGSSANPSWASVQSSITVQNFVTGTNFTPGTTTTLTLSSAPTTAASLEIYFDGVLQNHTTWTLSGSTITFSSALPYGLQSVECRWISSAQISNAVFNPGSSTTPGLAVSGNTSTGLFQNTTNTIGLSTNGVAALTLDASQNAVVAGYASATTPPSGDVTTKLATTAFVATYYPIVVGSIAALRANTYAYPTIYVEGYYTAGDGGDGFFRYNSSDTTTTDNNGTIIVDALGHRYYRIINNNTITPTMFGATGNGTTNDYTALQSAITATVNSNYRLYFNAGNYLHNTALNWQGLNNFNIEGSSLASNALNGTSGGVTLLANGISGTANDFCNSQNGHIKNITFGVASGSSTLPNVLVLLGYLGSGSAFSNQIVFENCFVQHATTAGWFCNGEVVTWRNCGANVYGSSGPAIVCSRSDNYTSVSAVSGTLTAWSSVTRFRVDGGTWTNTASNIGSIVLNGTTTSVHDFCATGTFAQVGTNSRFLELKTSAASISLIGYRTENYGTITSGSTVFLNGVDCAGLTMIGNTEGSGTMAINSATSTTNYLRPALVQESNVNVTVLGSAIGTFNFSNPLTSSFSVSGYFEGSVAGANSTGSSYTYLDLPNYPSLGSTSQWTTGSGGGQYVYTNYLSTGSATYNLATAGNGLYSINFYPFTALVLIAGATFSTNRATVISLQSASGSGSSNTLTITNSSTASNVVATYADTGSIFTVKRIG